MALSPYGSWAGLRNIIDAPYLLVGQYDLDFRSYGMRNRRKLRMCAACKSSRQCSLTRRREGKKQSQGHA